NLAAAAAAWRLARRRQHPASGADGHRIAASNTSRRPSWRRLACAFVAGANLMALEVLWFRFLLMFVVNSTLALSLILAVILAAIGCGGLMASRWLTRRPDAPTYLPALALAAGGASLAAYA